VSKDIGVWAREQRRETSCFFVRSFSCIRRVSRHRVVRRGKKVSRVDERGQDTEPDRNAWFFVSRKRTEEGDAEWRSRWVAVLGDGRRRTPHARDQRTWKAETRVLVAREVSGALRALTARDARHRSTKMQFCGDRTRRKRACRDSGPRQHARTRRARGKSNEIDAVMRVSTHLRTRAESARGQTRRPHFGVELSDVSAETCAPSENRDGDFFILARFLQELLSSLLVS
jgi:hypothetical protein